MWLPESVQKVFIWPGSTVTLSRVEFSRMATFCQVIFFLQKSCGAVLFESRCVKRLRRNRFSYLFREPGVERGRSVRQTFSERDCLLDLIGRRCLFWSDDPHLNRPIHRIVKSNGLLAIRRSVLYQTCSANRSKPNFKRTGLPGCLVQ